MRVGIITLYHNSINYGGNLQAYALCKYFMKRKIDVEQIDYNPQIFDTKKDKLRRIAKKGIFGAIQSVVNKFFSVLKEKYRNSIYDIDSIIIERRSAFHKFNREIIPHSSIVYNGKTIDSSVDLYDVFITGSDQVWNFAWYRGEYFLDFVPRNKKKVSYAASFSMSDLSESQKEIVKKSLKSFTAVSVREKDAAEFLSRILDKQVEFVLDPTLLLDIEDWEEICANRMFAEEYVFAYFLGDNLNAVKLAREFAHKKNMKLVLIPYASGFFRMNDAKFADCKILDASPEQFLSLIKYASFVFTDSFHAVVFSFIFQRQFFVFNRDKNLSMSSRIVSLTEMLNIEERFCNSKDKEHYKYIDTMKPIDYSCEFKQFTILRQISFDFINKNILDINE